MLPLAGAATWLQAGNVPEPSGQETNGATALSRLMLTKPGVVNEIPDALSPVLAKR
jgi:hypothetical protein